MHKNDISMHENENIATKIFMDENSMHENYEGKIFVFMHGNII